MNRILVIGSSGPGKSTLAREIGAALGIEVIQQIISRRIRYAGRSRLDMAPGCEERLTWEFLRWVWSYPSSRRPSILRRLTDHAPGRRIVRLRSRRAVAGFVNSLGSVERVDSGTHTARRLERS
jgi:adenylate kinase family enzyme